jgi:H+/Cl- antiporter ClcA
LSIFSYISENPFIQDAQQLLKVIIFGILGGAFGYLGKLIAIKIHKFFTK